MGLATRMEKSPWDISKDWRSDFSIGGPMIRVRTIGASGKSSFRRTYPTTPKRSMTKMSKTVLLTVLRPDHHDRQDDGHQDRVRDLEKLDPERDEGKIKDEQNHVSDVQARDDAQATDACSLKSKARG